MIYGFSIYINISIFFQICKLFQLFDIVPNVVQLVAIIHEDVTEPYQIEHFKNICKTHIHIQSINIPLILTVRLEHKRSNGKCVVQVIIKFVDMIYV